MNQYAHAGHEKEVENQELCNNRDLSNGISSRKKKMKSFQIPGMKSLENGRNWIFHVSRTSVKKNDMKENKLKANMAE